MAPIRLPRLPGINVSRTNLLRSCAAASVFVLVPLTGWGRLTEFAGPRMLTGAILFAVCLWWCARELRRGSGMEIRFTLIDSLCALFYVLYLASWVLSSNGGVSLTAVLLEAPFPLFYVFCRAMMREGDDARDASVAVAGAVTVTAVTLASWGLLQYFFEIDIHQGLKDLFKTHHYPVVASMGNPNYLSEFLVLALPFTVAFFTAVKRYRLMLVSLAIMGLAVYFTYSRLAWFVLACAMVLVIVFSRKPARTWLLVSLGAMIFITGAFFAFHYMSGSTRSDRVLQSFAFSRTTPLFERRVLYAAGFSMLRDAGAWGAGPGMFGHRYLEYQGRYINTAQADRFQLSHLVDIDHAHSDLIELAFDSGFAAAAAFLVLLLVAIVRGIARARRRDRAAFLALVPLVYLPFCLWSFPFYIPYSKILFIAALAAAASGSRPLFTRQLSSRGPALALALFLALWGWWGFRYAVSLGRTEQAVDAQERDPAAAEALFTGAVGLYPWNGQAYLGRGMLRAAGKDARGIADIRRSMDYVSDAASYLALARACRDQGRTADARRWYRKLMYMRPDIRKAFQEYRELGPEPADAREGSAYENNN